MSSDYAGNGNGNGQNFYPHQGYQRSNDNITAGSGSGGSHNTDQLGNSTDPSSVNSSMDRLQQQLQANPNYSKQERHPTAEAYGLSGFGPGPQLDGFAVSNSDGSGNGNIPPAPPPHTYTSREINGNGGNRYGHGPGYTGGHRNGKQQPSPPTPPVKDNSNATPQQPIGRRGTLRKNVSTSNTEKRQSWFKRRFSKS